MKKGLEVPMLERLWWRGRHARPRHLG